ncbi:MAG: hypothetical protein C0404_00025 [Verrucomicrobia bacterium]|nr:hypothetical protein [Verrucomicrobiota bacterium]
MLLKVRQFLTLAGLTATEAIRQPLCFLLTATSVFLTGLVPVSLMHRFAEEGKLDRDSGLAFHFILGLFVAGHAASSTLAREMRKGTASAVLSKPVSREVFFIAKYAGVALTVLVFSFCSTIATLLAERVGEKYLEAGGIGKYVTDYQTGIMLIVAPFAAALIAGLINFKTRRPFQSTAMLFLVVCVVGVFLVSGLFTRAGVFHPFDLQVQWRILPVSMLITMALLVLAAIALALSTKLNTVPTLTISFVVLMAGLMSDYLLGRRAMTSEIAAFVHSVLPDFQHFWVSDALIGGGTVPWQYVGGAGLYALVYSVGILCVGMLLFRRSEVK